VVAIITAVLAGVLETYAYLASHARQMFTNKPSVRRLNRSNVSVMVAAGVAIADPLKFSGKRWCEVVFATQAF